ncbi:unnamed protein product [Cuscuta epithymum]|uniref:Uncharacterized protein n=1 Tax=Cuscuta epithymum TaxID=186058 RepID=A0AAV0GFK5_9ASTE|nr:unnamed protein product [Cuscuta epithymum]
MSSAAGSTIDALHSSAEFTSSSMAVSTTASISSTTAPASATFTDAAVVITSAPVNMLEPQQVISYQTGSVVPTASSSLVPDVSGAYSLFQTIPSMFPWQPSVPLQTPGSPFSTPVPAPRILPQMPAPRILPVRPHQFLLLSSLIRPAFKPKKLSLTRPMFLPSMST